MSFHKDLVGFDLHIARFATGSGSPVGVITPGIIGEVFWDSVSNTAWVAYGLLNTNWTQLVSGGGGGTPAVSVVSETSFGQAPAVGVSTNYARQDHTHGTMATPQAVTDYAGRFEGTTVGTGDIGTDQWGWFWRTTDSRMFLVRNRAGVLYAVEATPL